MPSNLENANREFGDEPYYRGASLIPPEAYQKQDIAETLIDRGKKYGEFKGHADISQRIKIEMRNSKNWDALSRAKKECLEIVAHKIGRILNGDPNYKDSWHDIVGYVKLIDDNEKEVYE